MAWPTRLARSWTESWSVSSQHVVRINYGLRVIPLSANVIMLDENPESLAAMEPSDYLNTLLHDPTSSHLLETIVSRCPETAFAVLWSTYFHDEEGKGGTRGRLLPRLATHPVANFVLAKALERANAEQLGEACEVLEGGGWSKLVSECLLVSNLRKKRRLTCPFSTNRISEDWCPTCDD